MGAKALRLALGFVNVREENLSAPYTNLIFDVRTTTSHWLKARGIGDLGVKYTNFRAVQFAYRRNRAIQSRTAGLPRSSAHDLMVEARLK